MSALSPTKYGLSSKGREAGVRDSALAESGGLDERRDIAKAIEARTLRYRQDLAHVVTSRSALLLARANRSSLSQKLHVHLGEQARRGEEMGLGALAFPGALVQAAEPEMAVREQRAHLQLLRQRDRSLVIPLGLAAVERSACRGLGEHMQRSGRIAALAPLLRERQRAPGGGRCFVRAIGEQAGLAEQCEHCRLLHQQPL